MPTRLGRLIAVFSVAASLAGSPVDSAAARGGFGGMMMGGGYGGHMAFGGGGGSYGPSQFYRPAGQDGGYRQTGPYRGGWPGRPPRYPGRIIYDQPGPPDAGAYPPEDETIGPRPRRRRRPVVVDGGVAPPPRKPPPRVARAAPLRQPVLVVPTQDEKRFVQDEILLVVPAEVSAAERLRFERQYDLAPRASSRIALLNADVRRYGVRAGSDIRRVIQSLRDKPQIVASAQPNFLFDTEDDGNPGAPIKPFVVSVRPDDRAPIADKPLQYAIGALKIDSAHRLATGANVLIAMIDTGLDETHPEIAGMVAGRFDAVGGTFSAQAHGTAMAGVIVAHKTLVGIAPEARLLAIRAFSTVPGGGTTGTSYDILRGIDYAAAHGARIINMSFAGPKDALVGEALRAARGRGIIEVAAAGNAGPESEPLYPAAEPGVIAITATDSRNKLFAMANRGAYVAFAAPGVNILAPSVGNTVQLTSGTSVATAEATGVVALLIQGRARPNPDMIRTILGETALHLSPEAAAGAGVIDALAALNAMPR